MLLAPMGAQPRVFVTRQLPGGALDRLTAQHDVEVWPEPFPPPRAELLARAPELATFNTLAMWDLSFALEALKIQPRG